MTSLPSRIKAGKGADRQLRRSGAVRWNRLRSTLADALKHTSIHFNDISIETMAEMRDLVNDISQQFHEANAYRNSYLNLAADKQDGR